MRLVKIAAAVLGGLLVLAVAAIAAVTWLFDPNEYKDTLAAEFERRTGRTLVIEQDLALEYVPWLAVETGGVAVGNAPGFSERDFARVERLAARVELLGLVRGQLRVGTIVLEGLVLNLETDADGRGNWVLETPASDAEAAPGTETPSSPLETLGVDGLRVRDGAVTYRVLGAPSEYRVEDLTLTTGAYTAGEPMALEAAFRFAGSTSGLTAAIETSGTLAYAASRVTLADWRTRVEAEVPGALAAGGEARFAAVDWTVGGALATTGAELAGWVESAALGGGRRDVAARWPSARFETSAGRLDAETLTVSLDGLEMQVESLSYAQDRVLGAVTVAQAPLADALAALSVAPPDGVDAAELGRFDLSATVDARLNPFSLAIGPLDVRALGAAAAGRVRFGDERLVASLDAPAFAPSAGLRAVLAPYVPDGIALDAFDSLALAVELDVNTAADTITVGNLRVETLGASIEGNAELEFVDGELAARGRLASSAIEPRAFDAAFGALVTDTVDRRELGAVSFDSGFAYEGAADRLTLEPLRVSVFGLQASGALTASALASAPVYTGRARLEPFAPRELMRRFGQTPPATSDPAALGSARIDTRFEVTAERGVFRELELVLDDSRITGEFTVEDFEDPAYRFALAIDRLDADRYMAPPADEAEAGQRTAGDLELTGEALDLLDLSGRVEVGRLTLAGLAFANVATRIELGAGRVRLDEAGADLYGGRFDGAFGIDSSGELPAMTLTGRARGLNLAPLIVDLTGESANFSGMGDFDLALSGTGVTVTDNVRSARGTMAFTMRAGAIEGFDLGRTLCAAYNATQRAPAPPAADVPRTRYEVLSGTADVAGGVATSPDLLARTAFMDVTGGGSLDVVEQALDYELEATLTAPIPIPNCTPLDPFVGDSIPLTLAGTLEAPVIRPDFGEILKRRVQDELRDRATDRLEDRLRDRLRDLF